MKTVFCEVCHKPIKSRINLGKGSSVNLNIKCPDGHLNKIIIEGEKDMVTGNTPKTPDEIRKEMMDKRAERMANRPGGPFDPNAGKRAALAAQIKAWTGIVAQMQGQINNWNSRIAAAQAELNALPPAPVTPPAPPASSADKK